LEAYFFEVSQRVDIEQVGGLNVHIGVVMIRRGIFPEGQLYQMEGKRTSPKSK